MYHKQPIHVFKNRIFPKAGSLNKVVYNVELHQFSLVQDLGVFIQYLVHQGVIAYKVKLEGCELDVAIVLALIPRAADGRKR